MSRLVSVVVLVAVWITPLGCRQPRQPLPPDGAAAAVVDPPPVSSPADDYRSARYQEAVRGLAYDSGFVEFDDDADEVRAMAPPHVELADLLAQADAMMQVNRYVTAIKLCTAAVLVYPGAAESYETLGRALLAKRKTPQAAAAFRSALRLDPARFETRYVLGLALWMEGDLQAAEAEWQRLLQTAPDYGPAHQRLALGSYYAGNYATAWRHVHAGESSGAGVPVHFRRLLQDKMPEPTP